MGSRWVQPEPSPEAELRALHLALANATHSVRGREWARLGTVNESIQPLVDAFMAEISRTRAPPAADDLIAALAALPVDGPRPWRDGDPRCHCTHCDGCGRLFRTEDIAAHRSRCHVVRLGRAMGGP